MELVEEDAVGVLLRGAPSSAEGSALGEEAVEDRLKVFARGARCVSLSSM